MKFTRSASEEAGGSWLIANENDEINIAYNKANCQGYLLEMNIYEKLVYLAGYNNVEKVENKEAAFSIIQDAISKKYGKEETDKFFQAINDLYIEYNNTWKGEETYNLAVNLEKLFLNFMRQDISNLKTEKELKKFGEIYDFYTTKNIPEVRNNITGEIITNEFWEIDNEFLSSKLQEIKRNSEGR